MKVVWASQLPAPVVGEVSQPLREENPAALSRLLPSASTASTCDAIAGSSTAERP